MKKYFVSIAFFLMLGNVFAQKTVINDANAEIRSISGTFNRIEVSGGIDLYLSQYDEESLAISATPGQHKENIKTVVENKTLKIFMDGSRQLGSGNKKLKAYVSFKNLQQLAASGGSDIVVAGAIQVADLTLQLSGASDFKGAVKVDNLVIQISGASDVTVSGTANEVSIDSRGASDVKAYNLVAEHCSAKASGASDIQITVNKELNANASGASDIYYKGDGVLSGNQSSGASSVVKKG